MKAYPLAVHLWKDRKQAHWLVSPDVLKSAEQELRNRLLELNRERPASLRLKRGGFIFHWHDDVETLAGAPVVEMVAAYCQQLDAKTEAMLRPLLVATAAERLEQWRTLSDPDATVALVEPALPRKAPRLRRGMRGVSLLLAVGGLMLAAAGAAMMLAPPGWRASLSERLGLSPPDMSCADTVGFTAATVITRWNAIMGTMPMLKDRTLPCSREVSLATVAQDLLSDGTAALTAERLVELCVAARNVPWFRVYLKLVISPGHLEQDQCVFRLAGTADSRQLVMSLPSSPEMGGTPPAEQLEGWIAMAVDTPGAPLNDSLPRAMARLGPCQVAPLLADGKGGQPPSCHDLWTAAAPYPSLKEWVSQVPAKVLMK